ACPDYKDRIITCTAPSKSFNLAGMQLSNIVINNKELQEKWMLVFTRIERKKYRFFSVRMYSLSYFKENNR
ncbi:hypothetical protein ACTPEF_26015, partial [Clostridioides difficile]